MKTLIIKALAYCTIIIVGTACQTSTQDTTKADEDAVKALIELWDINDIKGDADLMASLYTDNAIMLGGFDGGLIRGNEAIQQYFASTYEENVNQAVNSGIDEIRVSGDIAYVCGSWTSTLANGESAGGDWLQICERQPNNEWLISVEIWNVVDDDDDDENENENEDDENDDDENENDDE